MNSTSGSAVMVPADVPTGYTAARCPGCQQFFSEVAGGMTIALQEPADRRPCMRKTCKKCKRMLFIFVTR